MVLPPLVLTEAPSRTPAIYRLPAAEGESESFARLVEEGHFDRVCIEPRPGPHARRLASGRLRFVAARTIDTRPNVRWRNATIDYVKGRISPRDWLRRTRDLHETVHFLSWAKAPSLRDATGGDSVRAVVAELFLLDLPGLPCLTADDTGDTRDLPGPGRLQSWFLAMNDMLGPMLDARHRDPSIVTGPIRVVRADPVPGLFVFHHGRGEGAGTVYLNNGPKPIPLTGIDMSRYGGLSRNLDLEGKVPVLGPVGYLSLVDRA